MVLTLLIIYLHMQNSQANRDYLTTLYNRSLGEQYLSHLITHREKNNSISGILMDINDFKKINDTYGHDLGDTSLRLFSRLLVDSFKGGWFIARYGGDEFILIREGTARQDLEEALAHFFSQLSLFNARNILGFPLSVSVGSALYEPEKHKDGPSFIKALDAQMYAHKRSYHAQHKQGPYNG
jgi:diguanylate cyclase (GGDEF)-like protein